MKMEKPRKKKETSVIISSNILVVKIRKQKKQWWKTEIFINSKNFKKKTGKFLPIFISVFVLNLTLIRSSNKLFRHVLFFLK